MITAKTPCGRTLLFSDCDAEFVNNNRFVYDQICQSVRYYNGDTNTFRSILPVLFNTPDSEKSKYGYFFADGNRFNFQRENVRRVSRAVAYRYRPAQCGKKYKGVSRKLGKLYVEVWVGCVRKDRQQLRFQVVSGNFTITEEYAAGVYNAILDYLHIAGYRNDVPKVELTDEQKSKVDAKMRQWGLME